MGCRANMGREILVDGYNVIKRTPSLRALETKSLEAARHALITQLSQRYRHTPHLVTVVFDGASPTEQVMHERRVRVIFSRSGEKADQVIERLAAGARAAGREVEMYSDDAEVQSSVESAGGTARSTEQLTSQFNPAPAHLERLARHRQQVRDTYGLDPTRGKQEDGEQQGPLHRKKKKR